MYSNTSTHSLLTALEDVFALNHNTRALISLQQRDCELDFFEREITKKFVVFASVPQLRCCSAHMICRSTAIVSPFYAGREAVRAFVLAGPNAGKRTLVSGATRPYALWLSMCTTLATGALVHCAATVFVCVRFAIQ